MKPFFHVPTTGQRHVNPFQRQVVGRGQFQVVPVRAGHAGVLLDRDVEALEQRLERVPKADVTERNERRRRDQQPGEQHHFALAAHLQPPVAVAGRDPPHRRGPEQIHAPDVEPVDPPVRPVAAQHRPEKQRIEEPQRRRDQAATASSARRNG